ncbi:MAG: sugar transferase, partial [Daejeonella sp.]|nr:sugar transferase [Daejeonella sp.]
MSQIIKQGRDTNTVHHLSIAYMGTDSTSLLINDLPSEFFINKHHSLEELQDYLDNQSILTLPDVILIETDSEGKCFKFIEKIKKNPLYRELIIVLIASEKDKVWKASALKLKVHDFYIMPFPIEHLIERLHFLVKFKLIRPQLSVLENTDVIYKLPQMKRLFDVVISATCIIVLAPVIILTAILIRLDSKGSIIYKSKRVGTGYNIFDFYKFRSMRVGADSQLEDLSDLNRYKNDEYPEEEADDEKKRTTFVKLIDDP